VKRVRVLMSEVPLMLSSILIDALSKEGDVELVGSDDPRGALDAEDVDVVLIGADDPHDYKRARTMIDRWPKSRVLIVSSSGREAVMYGLYLRKLVLGDVSPRTLVHIIRQGFAVM
jgi:hypothetical protein